MAAADTYNEANAEMEKIFQFVAKRIGRDWKWLGRKLKIDNCVIEGIEEDYKCTQEKAFQVLVRWSQKNGKAGATNEVLIKALQAIGKTFIAEEIHGFCEHGHGNVSQTDKQPIHTSCGEHVEETFTSPVSTSPSHTFTQLNDNNQAIKQFENVLHTMYRNCIDNLTPYTDRPVLVNTLKMAQNVLELNTILMKLTDSHDDETSMESIKKSCEMRSKQTDQAMRLILETLTERGQPRQARTNRTRPVSEIIPRCTSLVTLQPRCYTFSSGLSRDSISSPISISRQCLFSREPSPIHDRICEEPLDTEQPEEEQLIPRCPSCGSCCLNFEVERHASENKEISLDENYNQASKPDPISDESDADDIEDGSHDSKL